MKQTVKLNYLRIAPRKVRLVAGLLRGLPVVEAEAQLLYERRRPAKAILKLLRSAVASAKTTKQMDALKLYVESVRVDGGPMLKRSLPRARGSATPIHKKMSHITLTLAERDTGTARFTIVPPKKIKLPPRGTKGAKKTPRHTQGKQKLATEKIFEEHRGREAKKPGFWRKMFRRKSV